MRGPVQIAQIRVLRIYTHSSESPEQEKDLDFQAKSQSKVGSFIGSTEAEALNMEVVSMQRRWVQYIKSLFFEGFLDAQFVQLQQLQDESNPDFVVEVVSLFFQDSEKLLNDLSGVLDQPSVDFKKIDAHVHQLKGSSSSIGAQRVKNSCITFRNYCEQQNVIACHGCLQHLKQEYYLVKSKLENLFTLEQQIVAAGGSIPLTEINF